MLNVVSEKLKATICIFHFMLLYEFTGLFQLVDQQRFLDTHLNMANFETICWIFRRAQQSLKKWEFCAYLLDLRHYFEYNQLGGPNLECYQWPSGKSLSKFGNLSHHPPRVI